MTHQPLKARPIILRPHEVRGILDGTVTQLWRAMGAGQYARSYHPYDGDLDDDGWPLACYVGTGCLIRVECPWGEKGDHVWGRESWADVHPLQAEGRYSQEGQAGIPGPPGVTYRTIYRADGEYPPIWHATGYPYRALKPGDDLALKHWPKGVEYGWESSATMPLWASRALLEIGAVSALPVQEAMRGEGMYRIADFGSRWDQDNPRHLYASNPMAWRLVVRRIES